MAYITLNLTLTLTLALTLTQVAYVTYMMYELVCESMIAQVKASPGIFPDCSEVALLGGVQINRCANQDP